MQTHVMAQPRGRCGDGNRISLSMMSIAQAYQRPILINLHRAGYHYEHRWSGSVVYRPPRNPAAYHGHFTLPEFDPDYHGSNGG
jgi:hypothetical protein